MFDIILFSFHMHSLKSEYMKSRGKKTLLFSIHSATKATKKDGLNQSFMKIGKQ